MKRSTEIVVSIIALAGILCYLALRYGLDLPRWQYLLPLFVVLAVGGIPLLIDLARKLWAREFGSDLLAGISIATAVLLREYIVGCIVVLMLSGGTALEAFAARRASSILEALSRRMPSIAHQSLASGIADIAINDIKVSMTLVIFPHELCPVDGIVISGHGAMDESYLTGEPYVMSKAPGSQVLSGAINGADALTIEATKLPVDSRYARIMQVMQEAEARRPRIRRLGDQIGAWYTPIALAIAALGWLITASPERFLSVVVIATPCPLLLGIPIAIIGAISLAARRAIIVKNPAMLEKIPSCRTVIFDKTGTLTYGRPSLTGITPSPAVNAEDVLQLTASLEQYSRHPLARAVLRAAGDRGIELLPVAQISERPGKGMSGLVGARAVEITSRQTLAREGFAGPLPAPENSKGLQSLILIDHNYAATLYFRDEPREDSPSFIQHLPTRHQMNRIMIVSGDREVEVRYLAHHVGISNVEYGKTPEEKVAIVRAETTRAPTLFVGDGINDAPAMQAATVGLAFGQGSDITAAAADAVTMEPLLSKVDEIIHIGGRMRTIALQSAIGGMAASFIGMMFAVAGYLPPLAGAVAQEVIDVAAILNALRVTVMFGDLTDY